LPPFPAARARLEEADKAMGSKILPAALIQIKTNVL